MGGKGGRCVGLTTLPPSCPDCLEILRLEPPGALRDCTGIALPLPLPFTIALLPNKRYGVHRDRLGVLHCNTQV